MTEESSPFLSLYDGDPSFDCPNFLEGWIIVLVIWEEQWYYPKTWFGLSYWWLSYPTKTWHPIIFALADPLARKSKSYEIPVSQSGRKRLKEGMKKLVKIGGDPDDCWFLDRIISVDFMSTFSQPPIMDSVSNAAPKGDRLRCFPQVPGQAEFRGVAWLTQGLISIILFYSSLGLGWWHIITTMTSLHYYYHCNPYHYSYDYCQLKSPRKLHQDLLQDVFPWFPWPLSFFGNRHLAWSSSTMKLHLNATSLKNIHFKFYRGFYNVLGGWGDWGQKWTSNKAPKIHQSNIAKGSTVYVYHSPLMMSCISLISLSIINYHDDDDDDATNYSTSFVVTWGHLALLEHVVDPTASGLRATSASWISRSNWPAQVVIIQ